MATRDTPYPAFNFTVEMQDGSDATSALGGFADVTGLGTENTLMDYRQGNDKENHVRKIPGIYKVSDVTFNRGIMGLTTFWDWVNATRTNPQTQRTLKVTLNDEQGQPVMTWSLINARPSKWTGPSLAGKGGSDVAMEELVVVSESFKFGA